MFETSASLLESVDLLLAGQSGLDLAKAPSDSEVFSPLSKPKKSPTDSDAPPPLSLSPAASDARKEPVKVAQLAKAKPMRSRLPPSLPPPHNPSKSPRRNNLSAETKSDLPPLQQSKRHPVQQAMETNQTGKSHGLDPIQSPKTPIHNQMERRHTSPLSLRRSGQSPELQSQQLQKQQLSHPSPPSQKSQQSTPSTSSPILPALRPSPSSTRSPIRTPQAPTPVKLDKESLQQLISTIRETVKAEIDENLTDLRNDIVNIHSEMVVMASQHSEELRRVVMDRDEGLARLQDENEKLRAENERLQQKYGLFS